jgi:cell division transport system ATP-binding protein
MTEAISLSKVSYRGVLAGFDLRIHKGSLTVVLGPSGSGKTTLFKLLTGELRPESGEIVVGGVSVASLGKKELARYRQSIGVVFQDVSLLDDRSVAEQIALPLEIEGMTRDEYSKRTEEVIARFALGELRDKYPRSLSMSERQRVAIARAVASEPLVLLADEPAAHLDWPAGSEIANLFMHEHLRGMTILIGTNSADFARLFSGADIIPLAPGISGTQN